MLTQQSYGQKRQLGHKSWFFGHNSATNQYIMEILVSFDRADQGLLNDTKFAMSDFIHWEVRNAKIPENPS